MSIYTNQTLIEIAEEECGHRLDGPAKIKGKWITWGCTLSAKTMGKFVDRVKKASKQPTFFRDGTFGVLADV
ncbi:MAG: hypothetical protein ACREBY_18330 [Polaromonas sp.]